MISLKDGDFERFWSTRYGGIAYFQALDRPSPFSFKYLLFYVDQPQLTVYSLNLPDVLGFSGQ